MSDHQQDQAVEQLPFNTPRQDAVLGHLLTNDTFFKQCKDRIKPEWFIDGYAQKVFIGKCNFFKILSRCPNRAELLSCDDFAVESMNTRNMLHAKMVEAENMAKLHGLDTLVPELTKWFHSRVFQEAIGRSQTLYNNGKFPEAFALMTDRMKYINSSQFVEEKTYDFSNFQNHIARRETEVKSAISFGISAVDRIMLPLGEGKGSLLPGDTTLLMAPTNIGKTSSKITIAAYNVMKCQPTLLLTHEGVDDDIAEKMVMSMMGLNRAQVFALFKDQSGEGYRLYQRYLNFLNRWFTYLPMNKPGLSVEEVIATVQHLQEARKSKWGDKYKLLIDDYPAKLGSQSNQFGQFQKRNMDEYVYNCFVQLALEEKFHNLLSQQINRTGSKINRGQKGFEHRLLTPEDANESYGPSQLATNIITENRSPSDERLGFITYNICKSRGNAKGWVVVCRSEYEKCITHSDKLGCTWYHGDVPLGEVVDSMFVAYFNQEIPYKAIKDFKT